MFLGLISRFVLPIFALEKIIDAFPRNGAHGHESNARTRAGSKRKEVYFGEDINLLLELRQSHVESISFTAVHELDSNQHSHLAVAFSLSAIGDDNIAPPPRDQLEALEDIFNSFGGSNWNWDSAYGVPWDFPTTGEYLNPCTKFWQGIICNCLTSSYDKPGHYYYYYYYDDNIDHYLGYNNSCTIEALDLTAMNLDGTIPSSIGKLSGLQSLRLSHNKQLNGSIPTELWSLRLLERLYLSHIAITGELSTSISQLSNLIQLSLSGTSLSGPYPLTLFDLTNLEQLYLGSSPRLTGDISSSLSKLQNLQLLNAWSVDGLLGTVVPSALYNLKNLTHLLIQETGWLSNTIPSEIFDMTNLETLFIGMSGFTGTISSDIQYLKKLKKLLLYGNSLSGSIPSQLQYLNDLSLINLGSNRLTGTITSEIKFLDQMTFFSLSFNLLSGTIPTEIGAFSEIIYFDLHSNALTGTLPTQISSFTAVTNFDVMMNSLTGIIPSEVQYMTSLNQIYLNQNFLTGSVPSEIRYLQNLWYLELNNNHLTGKPPIYSGTESLISLDFSNNLIYGSISTEIEFLQHLIVFSGSNNLMTGSIPTEIQYLSNLESIYLSDNFLSGSIPPDLHHLSNLQFFYLSDNVLSSTLPESLSNATNLAILSLQDNMFSGTLPSAWMRLTTVVAFNLSNNYISGSLPVGLSNFKYLQQCELSHNLFTGSLYGIFNTSSQQQLEIIDVSYNNFDNSIPASDIFNNASSIKLFSASANCFNGSIPADICDAPHLQYLILNGINTASRCRKLLINPNSVFNSTAYSAANLITGTIPSCLLSMKSLQSLYLAGNGIIGRLPEPTAAVTNSSISHSLKTINLAYNALTGTISHQIQSNNWDIFDVSYNRLTGSLSDGISMNPSNSTFVATVNRLSGTIPSVLLSFQNVNLLYGNMFSCNNSDESMLPSSDPNVSTYSCGSNDIDYAFYGCLLLFGIIVAIILAWYLSIKIRGKSVNSFGWFVRFKEVLIIWMEIFVSRSMAKRMLGSTNTTSSVMKPVGSQCENSDAVVLDECVGNRASVNPSQGTEEAELDEFTISKDRCREPLIKFGEIWRSFQVFTAVSVSSLLLLFLPAYGALSADVSSTSVTNRYGWVISSMFLQGNLAGWLLLVLVIVFVFMSFTAWCVLVLGWKEFTFKTPINKNLSPINDKIMHDERKLNLFEACLLRWNHLRFYFLISVIFLGNIVLVCFVNIYFVIATSTQSVNSKQSLVLSAAMSMFKSSCTWIVVPYFLKQAQLFSNKRNIYQNEQASVKGSAATTVTLLLIAQVNMIIIPSIVVMIASPNCFAGIFNPQNVKDIILSYSYTSFEANPWTTTGYTSSVISETLSQSFSPPFLYSYQCSSNVISQYASVYIFQFISSIFVMPIIRALIVLWYPRILKSIPRRFQIILSRSVPEILKPAGGETNLKHSEEVTKNKRYSASIVSRSSFVHNSICSDAGKNLALNTSNYKQSELNGCSCKSIEFTDVSKPLASDSEGTIIVQVKGFAPGISIFEDGTHHLLGGSFIDLNKTVAIVSSVFSIVISIGVIYPPLALLGFLAMNIQIITFQLLLSRVWKYSVDLRLTRALNILNKNCQNARERLIACQLLFIPLPFIFTSFFILDTMGSQTSPVPTGAVLAPAIFMACLPFVLWIIYRVLRLVTQL